TRCGVAPVAAGGAVDLGNPVACLPQPVVVPLRGNHNRSDAAERRRYKTDSPQAAEGSERSRPV
ncbi:MAG: hypothetical protein NT069_31650, partial [Planctomycetota bacterium]|nr:hypothetical protein [Planctomycetota bacterium]